MREWVVVGEGKFEKSVPRALNVMIHWARESKEYDPDVASRSITMLFFSLFLAEVAIVSEGSGTVEKVAANIVRLLFEGLGKQSSNANIHPRR